MARKEKVTAIKKAEPVVEENGKTAPKSRLKKFKPDQTIRLLVEENPKRKDSGAYKRYELYRNGMSVQDAIDAGITPADLDYDSKNENIKIVA